MTERKACAQKTLYKSLSHHDARMTMAWLDFGTDFVTSVSPTGHM